MPYKVYGNCVHKLTASGKKGELVKCHDSAGKARAHMRALYAAENKEQEPEPQPQDQPQEYLRKLKEGADKEKGVVGVVKKALGLTEHKPRPVFGEDGTGLFIWKSAKTGTYHWISRYSNNARDKDSPAEIISAASHKQFVERVEKGDAPLPELWLWHVPDLKWGQATWVAYDETKEGVGFALAGGYVLPGCEDLAEHFMALDPRQVRVSHGMPRDSIRRDPDDPTIIIAHETREISPLPAWAAANPYTGFFILTKEQDMAIPDEKKKALEQEWGLPDDVLAKIELLNAQSAKEIAGAGIETKDADDAAAAVGAASTAETVTEDAAPAEAPAEAPAQAAEPAAAPEPGGDDNTKDAAPELALTREEVAEVLKPIVSGLETLVKAVQDLEARSQKIESQVKELAGADEEKVARKAAATPPASLAGLVFGSVIGSDDARVDGRKVKGVGPQETPPDAVKAGTGIAPIIAAILAEHSHTNDND